MSNRRFYLPQDLPGGELITLPGRIASHVTAVLRLGTGDQITLFNGMGLECVATIESLDGKRPRVRIEGTGDIVERPSFTIHLGLVLIKSAAMDYSIQKATELGAQEITPLLSERCGIKLPRERQAKRISHWQEITLNSCEQCGRHYPPRINPVLALDSWIDDVDCDLRVALVPGSSHHLDGLARDVTSMAILVGPEGGFGPDELNRVADSGFTATGIGPRTLRAETAPVVALALAQYIWGDLGGSGR